MSPIQTILGFWRSTSTSASSSSNIDIEAQTHTTVVSGTHTPLPISLAAPAAAHAYAPASRNTATNPADDFFGVTRTVRDSRHDDVRMSTPSEEMPPPYLYTSRDEEECLPAYDAPLAEPTTLAQYLLRFTVYVTIVTRLLQSYHPIPICLVRRFLRQSKRPTVPSSAKISTPSDGNSVKDATPPQGPEQEPRSPDIDMADPETMQVATASVTLVCQAVMSAQSACRLKR
ncbi:hypothetical protein FIBSPDRAFT_952018 [Athelia psychrophila]|uniref:Uncharacterized protein n=1 Tax=Athelia psychrophila TaxID=1759441 RepID=A0A166LZX9_9AGAM|nr:hypothetical protein FIBSPDRAFT_952018 [Fibularhizoctonia sp. CBS 109695]